MICGYLRDIMWRNKDISIESKLRMTYAIGTRAETALTKKLLRTTKIKTLRSITGFALKNRKRNQLIKEQCNIQDIVRWSRQRRREWRDHVNRMDDEKLAKIAMSEKPNTLTYHLVDLQNDGVKAGHRNPKTQQEAKL